LTPVDEADLAAGDGDDVCDLIETLCTVSKDGFAGAAGANIVVRRWQRMLIRHLFARYASGPKKGRRRFRLALIGMPRKNGKSGIASGFALDGLLTEGRGAEIYSAAAEKEQAKIVFGEVKRTVEASPELLEHCRPMRDVIEVPATNSIYRALSAEAYSKEGLNISRAIIDELHAHPTRELFDVLNLATGARKDPMVIAITTAGVKTDTTGQNSVCYELYLHGIRVATGEVDDPSFFFAWWGAPEGADHTDPAVWEGSNPGYGDLIDPEDFAAAVKRTPENEFRTKRLNQWVSSAQAWFPAGVWERLADVGRQLEPGERVVLGFDGSRNGDTTALVAVTVEPKPHVVTLGCWERPFDAAADWQVPRAEVLELMRESCLQYDVVSIAVDSYLWQTEMADLELEGLPIVSVPQTAERMVPATQRFYEMAMDGGLTHDGNPTMARHIGNAVLRTTQRGAQLAKESKGSPRKIDLAVAAVIAVDEAANDDGEVNLW
jgi:phage terminase large subunit-like protein